ncbi:MAG: LacI family DNA-binding transcriptional regulator, partial [Pseudobutyrivibrio sp.]|nr:LacI family DNA-binding transcriptional regulator [Pseudobutyrivibrio sp.]
VSRAFNDYDDIKEETKQTILATARALGYVPNLNAKRLSGKACQTMAIILVGFMADRGLTDELVIKLLRGACKYGDTHNVEFAVYVLSSEQQKEKSFEQFCSEHSLAGAMCFGLKTDDTYYDYLRDSKTPCVAVDILLEGENVGYVGTDDIKAFEELTELVISNGHKNIVLLNGRKEAQVCTLRQAGFDNAMKKHGLKPAGVFYTDFNAENARKITMDYIKARGNTEPTAFICASDLVALGATNGINCMGYKVGQDFAVTGFDGMHMASLIFPAITTVDQNMEDKGYAAAEMLHSIVDGSKENRKVIVPYSLIATDSVGYPN